MRTLGFEGQFVTAWLVVVLLISLFGSAAAGHARVTGNGSDAGVVSISVPVSAKAASFLLDHTYNTTLGLCSEVCYGRNNSLNFPGQVFWVCSDNLLAYYALQDYNKTVSDTIKSNIMAYAENYSLLRDSNGIPISYKHEAILGDTLPDFPLESVRHDLTQRDSYLVSTEINNGGPWDIWNNSADECAWMGMSFLNKGDIPDANASYNRMMSMWDGCGFADAAYNDSVYNDSPPHYESYKLALAIILRQRLNLTWPLQERKMEDILAICQQPDGGIATGYSRSLSTADYEENTETAALTVIANVSLSKHEDVKVGFYYYVWYGEGLGGRHWNDSDVAPVVDKPILGYYNSQNATIIRQHLNWFKDLNISFLIISWWGPNSYEDNATKTIFSIAKQYNYPIEIAIMVEAYNQSGMYDFKAIYDYINDTYIMPYESIYMKLDDLPLVCFFNDNVNMTRTEENIAALRSAAGFSARIVGHTEKYVDWWAWPLAGYQEAPQPRLSRDGYIGILPSYDDTHLLSHTNTTYDINYTEGLYDKQWNETLALENGGQVSLVAIYSWNEYHERSEVEPHISPEVAYVLSPFSKTYHYTQMIPEFPLGLVFPLFMIATLPAVVFYVRKRKPF